MKMFRGKLEKELSQAYKSGREIISREIRDRGAESKAIMIEVGKKQRALEKLLLRKSNAENAIGYHDELAQTAQEHLRAGHAAKSGRAKRALDSISRQTQPVEDDLAKLRSDLALLDEDGKILANLYTGTQSDPRGIISLVKMRPDVQTRFPSIGGWFGEVKEVANTKHSIYKSVSRNINNEPKFVKEYLGKIHGRTDDYATAWKANPQNSALLNELSRSKKFEKYIDVEDTTKAARESLKGLSRAQIAKKLSIVGGAGLAGAVAYMTWFDEEGEEIAEQAKVINTNLGSINASGLGAVILQDTGKALENINKLTSITEDALGKNPETAAPNHIKMLIQQKAILDKNLARWDTVVKSSNNPDVARSIGEGLRTYSRTLEKQLNRVGEKTGITKKPGKTPESGVAGDIRKGPISREHIKSIQNYLSSRFPVVGSTGNLDRPTIRSLKILEREYDRLGKTDRHRSGRLLVRPDEGHLIELSDLKELDQRMQQYKR